MRLGYLVGVAALAAGLASGCGVGKSDPVNFTAQLMDQPTTVPAGTSIVFHATTNDPKGVTWTLSPSSGAGTLSNIQSTSTTSSVTYQAPFTPPTPNSVTIKVASVSDSSVEQSDVFSVQAAGPAISVSITDRISTANAVTYANPVTVNATVTNDPANAGVQWELLSGTPLAPCAPKCGTLTSQTSSQVSYTPPAAVPSAPGNAVTITATSVTDNTKSDSDPFTIQYPTGSLSLLSGVYNFVISGFDSAGHPMGMAGSLTANGDGTISNVFLDVNDNQTVHSGGGASLDGAYTVANNFTGTIALNGTISGVPHNPAFAFVLSSDGSLAQIMSFDANGYVMGGYLLQSNTGQFSLPQIGGTFAFALNSNLLVRSSTIGRFGLDESGDVINGFSDSSQAGVGPTSSDSALTGTIPAIDPGTGRGTASLDFAGTTFNYVVYVVNANRLLFLETDSGSGQLQSGVAERSNFRKLASDNGTGYFAMQGYDTATGAAGPMGALAILSIANGTLGTLTWDSNDAGTIHSSIAGTAATVTYEAGLGRGTVSIPGGAAAGLFDSAVFYFTTTLNGFILDTTVGASNKALEGPIHPVQAGNNVPINSPLILGGNLLLAEAGPPGILDSTSASNPGAVALVNAANGAFTGNMTVRTLGQQDVTNAAFAGSFHGIDPNTGRGTAMLPGILFGEPGSVPGVFYIGSQNLFVVLCTAPNVKAGLVGFNPQ